jgi:hypothetical protein
MNRALVGALQYGRTLTIKFATLEGLDDKLFVPGVFPVEVLNRSVFFKDEIWQSIIKTELGDPEPNEMSISSEFVLIICTGSDYIPPLLRNDMCVVKVVDKQINNQSTKQDGTSTTDPLDQIASMFGAVDIIRLVCKHLIISCVLYSTPYAAETVPSWWRRPSMVILRR